MTNPNPELDLLITKRHPSFSPGFLETAYPVLSPYAPPDHHGNIRSDAYANSKSKGWCQKELLPLSAADALDLVVATSGLFRDYVGSNK